jgi:hypothetical protein
VSAHTRCSGLDEVKKREKGAIFWSNAPTLLHVRAAERGPATAVTDSYGIASGPGYTSSIVERCAHTSNAQGLPGFYARRAFS